MITTVYDLIPLHVGLSWRRPVSAVGYKLYLRHLRKVDRLIAISSSTAAELAQVLGVRQDTVVVAPPGVNRSGPPADPAAPSETFFLYIGAPDQHKNVPLLLDAMADCADLPEGLVIIGEWLPRQLRWLNARARSDGLSGRVKHLGYVGNDRFEQLVSQATAVVLPSTHEGFGLPVAEAMALGTLVIHSAIPVLEEVSDGAAMTFEPRSVASLATCLRLASSSPEVRNEIAVRGLARARELTWEAATNATLAVYEDLLRAAPKERG
jgi:alpha-1,3-rhamnosyl/mannosyltransferase